MLPEDQGEPKLRFVSFAQTEQDVTDLLLALRSLKMQKLSSEKVLAFVPKPVIDNYARKHNIENVELLFKSLRAKLVTPFPKGYNEKIGFRTVIKNIERRLNGAPMVYFSPQIIFRDFDLAAFTKKPVTFANAADDFWPERSLYDPPLEEFWSDIAKTAGVRISSWIDKAQPVNYWRRYPSFDLRLFYAKDATTFANLYDEFAETLQKSTPEFLDGMGPAFVEATMAVTAMKSKAVFNDVGWGQRVFTYVDKYDLVLRMDQEQYDWMSKNIIRTNELRELLKSDPENKALFFQDRLQSQREGFDEIERNYSIRRMQALVENRKVREQIAAAVRRIEEKT